MQRKGSMKRKQIFGFDYTNNEYMKIFMYLLVGGSAALLALMAWKIESLSHCCRSTLPVLSMLPDVLALHRCSDYP